ncbi:MAG TPA: hypothetical protein VEV87_04060 [Chitinophagaceae bacterium]|nr:hypothetical protein [Chitinophagaceae bacterium]
MESLRNLGYTALTIPAEDIKPLMLLLKTSRGVVGNLNSPIDDLWETVDMRPPAVNGDIPLPALVSGSEKLDLKVESNFNLLKALTSILSTDASASFTFEKNGEASYQIVEPKKDNINIIKLDAFLQNATLKAGSESILEKLEDGDLYVVTEIMKAKEFVVEIEAEMDTSASLKVPVKEIVDASGNVVLEKEKKSVIRYKGDQYLTFGFKAYKIFRKKGIFSSNPGTFRIRPAEDIKIYRSDEEFPAVQLADTLTELQPII